jgi:fido (protein-threonine AMPylation protein)
VPGAFQASPEFDYDPLATAEEIGARGRDVLRWLAALAESEIPRAVDIHLIFDVHRRWFESTFPSDAGHPRTSMVLNRKGTAVEVAAIVPALVNACDNWIYRRQHRSLGSIEELVEIAVAEANTLTVDVYDTHPFLDGNTRTTWHLRNYLLMLDGLRPLIDLTDEDAYKAAWWSATAHDHEALDAIVIDELARQDR